MSDCKYTLWFDQTYSDTYLTVRRAGRILLAHLCPALLGALDELLDSTYSDMSRKEWLLRRHPNRSQSNYCFQKMLMKISGDNAATDFLRVLR